MKSSLFLLATLCALSWAQQPSTLPPPESTTRGNDTVDPIIVNGERAQAGEFPHQAFIIESSPNGGSACGGSLIHPMVILTAAHCANTNGATYEVRMGGTNINRMRYVNRPNRKVVHENYNPRTLENDVALLFLTAPAEGEGIGLIQLAPANAGDYAGQDMIISGFGRTMDGGPISEDLNKANQRAISNQQCSQMGGPIVPSTLCTVPPTQTREIACNGDSGGPLVLPQGNGGWLQTGVASFVTGRSCEQADRNGYARVSAFRNWIETNMAPHQLP